MVKSNSIYLRSFELTIIVIFFALNCQFVAELNSKNLAEKNRKGTTYDAI